MSLLQILLAFLIIQSYCQQLPQLPQLFNDPTKFILNQPKQQEIKEHDKHHLNLGHQHNQQKSDYNQTQVNGEGTSHGLRSPYNVFLEDSNGLLYFTYIKIQTQTTFIQYKVSVDISQPFTFLTELQGAQNDIHLTKMHISQAQTNLIIQYIKPKFKQIEDYAADIYYVLNSTFWVNDELETNFSFFYLIGYGAVSFQYETTLDGYLGAGINHFVSEPSSLNIVIALFQSYILTQPSFSLYIGNDPGYIDSIFFLGSYQQFFMQKNQFTEIQMYADKEQMWNMKIENLSITFNTDIIYSSQNSLNGYVSTIYPYILITKEIAAAIQKQIQKDDIITCEYRSQLVQSVNATLLQCSSKMPVSESLHCPNIILEVFQANSQKEENGTNQYYNIILSPEDYMEKCLYDVENYAQICITNLAVMDDTQDAKIILGLPFLKSYYSYYQLQNNSMFISKAYQFNATPEYSQFWYYSFQALLIFWAILMMTCGLYFKDQMDSMIIFVNNIIKYLLGDQQARQQLIIGYLIDEQQ